MGVSGARQDFGDMNKAYSSAFRRYGDSSASVMIPKDNQVLRFSSISRFLPRDVPFSYLDFGCGLGHQYEHFRREGFDQIEFTGGEVNDDFLEHCRAKHTGAKFLSRDELFGQFTGFDFVGAVGAFNLVYSPQIDHQQFVFEEVRRLWGITRRGLFLNFMSTVVDYQQQGAFHQDLGSLYSFIGSSLSRRIFVDSGYLPYEYTMAVFRG